MINHKTQKTALVFSIMASLLIGCLTLSGCKDPTTKPDSTTAKKLPKLYLHCPDEFKPSVKRLREIYDAITSSDPMPAPIVSKVVEIIHGEGAEAHSHYYKVGQDRGDHREETEKERIHEIEVDAFTEFRDVAWILPNLAADSDMNEKDWLIVKKAAWGMVEVLDDAISNDQSTEEKRAAYNKNKEAISTDLQKLESIIPSDGSTDPNEN